MAGILKVDRIQSDSNLAFAIAGSNVAFMNATSLQMAGSNISLGGTNVFTSGKLVTAAQPVGAVLQVVNVTFGTFTTFTTSTFVDSGLSASITPTSATSNVLVQVCLAGCGKTGTDSAFVAKLVRGSTTITNMEGNAGSTGTSATSSIGTVAISYLDSPATTSSTTYKVQCMSASNASSTRINDYYSGANPSVCTMTLMEISA